MCAVGWSPLALSRISKRSRRSRGSATASMPAMRAASGAERAISVLNTSSRGTPPSTWTRTPSPSLTTHPASPSVVASRNTNGRKPTPCTTPRIRNRRASTSAAETRALLLTSHLACSTAPADRHDPPVLHEDRHRAGSGDRLETRACRRIALRVVLHEHPPLPLEMLAELRREGTRGGAVQVEEGRHESPACCRRSIIVW